MKKHSISFSDSREVDPRDRINATAKEKCFTKKTYQAIPNRTEESEQIDSWKYHSQCES